MNNPLIGALTEDLLSSGWKARPADHGFYKTIVHNERLASYFLNILNIDGDCRIEIRKFDQALQKVVCCYQYSTTVDELLSGGEGYIEDLLIRADNEYLDDHYLDNRNRSYLNGLQ